MKTKRKCYSARTTLRFVNACKRRGLKQEYVASLLGCSQGYVSTLFNGQAFLGRKYTSQLWLYFGNSVIGGKYPRGKIICVPTEPQDSILGKVMRRLKLI